MNEREKELVGYFDMLLHVYYYGNHMYRGLMQRRGDLSAGLFYQNLEEALQWGLVHGRCEQHGPNGYRYQSLIGCVHRVLNTHHIEHIERQIQKAKELTMEEEKQKKAATPVRDMEAIKRELLVQFVKESQLDELSNLFSYGRVYRNRIEWKGKDTSAFRGRINPTLTQPGVDTLCRKQLYQKRKKPVRKIPP